MAIGGVQGVDRLLELLLFAVELRGAAEIVGYLHAVEGVQPDVQTLHAAQDDQRAIEIFHAAAEVHGEQQVVRDLRIVRAQQCSRAR